MEEWSIKIIMMHFTNLVLKILLKALLVLNVKHSAAQPKSKPNVLFIFADDQTIETIGSLNNSIIKTPNLDRLRERDVTFTNAFNQGSFFYVCRF